MIDTKELRIGNIVTVDTQGDITMPTGIPFIVFDISMISCQLLDDLEKPWATQVPLTIESRVISPIPITPEWLERLGYKKGSGGRHFYSIDCHFINNIGNPYNLSINPINGIVWAVNKNEELLINFKTIKFIHQLQNLYFALTGQELTVKELTVKEKV